MPAAAAAAAVTSASLLDADQHVQCSVDEMMMPLQRVRVAVLGARGVGKTSLVCQFVYHDLHPPHDQRRAARSNTEQLYTVIMG